MGQSASSPENTRGSNDSLTGSRSTHNEGRTPVIASSQNGSKQQRHQSFSKRRSTSATSLSNFPPLPYISLASAQDWKESLGNLNDKDLQEVILSAPLSEMDIKTMAARIYQHHYQPTVVDDSASSSNGGNQTSRQSSSSEADFYIATTASSASQPQQLDDELTALCFRILRISPIMAKLRFRLVPTKLKEHLFWQALWTILYETIQKEAVEVEESETQTSDPDQHGTSTSTPTSKTVNDPPAARSFLSSPFATLRESGSRCRDAGAGATATTTSTGDSCLDRDFADFQKKRVEETIFNLRRTIEKQEWKMQEMQREIEQLNNKGPVWTDPASPAAADASRTPLTTPSPPRSSCKAASPYRRHHRGEWVIDQDSKDFLEYPAELKDNLRMEKQKRLQEVEQQMKFILDSDDIEDTNGQWSCCGQSSYRDECHKANT